MEMKEISADFRVHENDAVYQKNCKLFTITVKLMNAYIKID